MRIAAAVLVLALTGCGGGGGDAGSVPVPGPSAGADYFPLAVGNRWAYQGPKGVVTVDVTGTRQVEGRTLFVFRTVDVGATSEQFYEKSAAGVVLRAGPGADALNTLLDGVALLRLPLVAGQTEVQIDRALPGVGDIDGDGIADRIDLRMTSTMVGFEPLSSPLGDWNNVVHMRTVLTQVITLSLGNRRLTSTATQDDWYAPDIGPVRNETTFDGVGSMGLETLKLAAYRTHDRRSDDVAPTVTSAPAAGVAVGRLSDIVLGFSEPMYAPSLEGGGFYITGPDGAVVPGTLVVSGATLGFLPAGPAVSGPYTAQLTTAAQDIAGNAVVTPVSWRFTLDATGPRVLAVSPADGSTEVALDAVIRITFDEAPAPASLPGGIHLTDAQTGDEQAFTLATDGATVSLRPAVPLQPRRRYALHVGTTVHDTLGNSSEQDYAIGFSSDLGRFGEIMAFDRAGSGVAYDLFGGSDVAFGDVDGDGRGDLLIAPGGHVGSAAPLQPLVWVWRMQPDGQLRAPLRVEAPPGYSCRSPALAVLDFDGDGRADLAVGSECGIALYRQGADGVLVLREVLPAPALLRLRAADMDGDGRADLVGIGWDGTEAWIWTQLPGGGFGPRAGHAVDYFGWTTLALGDFTGDSRADIVIAGANTVAQAVAMLPQRADGSFGPPSYAAVDGVWGASGVAVGDLNGDGRADVVAGVWANTSTVALFAQRADGTVAQPLAVPGGGAATALAVADLNGDGRLDLVVAHEGAVTVYEQQPDRTLGPEIVLQGLGSGGKGPYSPGLLVVDLDGNGLPDIVLNGRYVLQRQPKPTAVAQALRSGLPAIATAAGGFGRSFRALVGAVDRPTTGAGSARR